MVKLEFWQNLICQSARDPLRNFSMGLIPIHRIRLDCQRNGGILSTPDVLQTADIDFRDQLQPALRWLLDILAEQVPVVGQRNKRQPADGNIFSDEKTR